MREREKIWVLCKKGFVGESGYEYEKGTVYKGYKGGRRYFLTLPGFDHLIEISEPREGSGCFTLVDPFLININKVLE